MSHQFPKPERKILYKVTDTDGKSWIQWLYLYQVDSYIDLGYTVKEMHA